VLLLESKGFGQSLDYAFTEVKGYAEHFPKCQVLITSNGYCYKAYHRKAGGSGFEDSPSAYLNLLRPTKTHPLLPGVGGATELLAYLLPRS